jgi:hypothetical protein
LTKQNAVTYAEDTLGVHVVWEEAQQRIEAHGLATEGALRAKRDIRDIEERITDREAEITSDERGANPDMKITAFKEHLKVAFANDSVHQALVAELANSQNVRDGHDADMRHHELGIRALTARMTELGGLLEFYAAAKRPKPRHDGDN